MLCFTGCLSSDADNRQVLDQLPVERARGITVKAQVCHMSSLLGVTFRHWPKLLFVKILLVGGKMSGTENHVLKNHCFYNNVWSV